MRNSPQSFKPVAAVIPTLSWLRKVGRIGQWGEQVAAVYLIERGYDILTMNLLCSPYGEIDIIAEKDGIIIFVEVKTYSKKQLGTQAQKIDYSKLKKLEAAINKYAVDMQVEKDISLDVICVYLQPLAPMFKHFKGIRLDA